MKSAPILYTERLILRSFTLEDAADVQSLTDDPDMASTSYDIEYPYKDGMAEKLIEWYNQEFEKGEGIYFAITFKTDGTLIGEVDLTFRTYLPYKDASLNYWIGKSYWNCGYCTEAAKTVVAYGFCEHDIELIFAEHFKRNSASGRVMQKIGMHYNDFYPKDPEDDSSEDTIVYIIQKSEFEDKC
ncbi:MAG: GNAT family N-acetyltransferase [Candidatus Poribacteria bacterium]|nr:GNAT family N-acetyltransferase [Candidatus Poribacteria bacterium]